MDRDLSNVNAHRFAVTRVSLPCPAPPSPSHRPPPPASRSAVPKADCTSRSRRSGCWRSAGWSAPSCSPSCRSFWRREGLSLTLEGRRRRGEAASSTGAALRRPRRSVSHLAPLNVCGLGVMDARAPHPPAKPSNTQRAVLSYTAFVGAGPFGSFASPASTPTPPRPCTRPRTPAHTRPRGVVATWCELKPRAPATARRPDPR